MTRSATPQGWPQRARGHYPVVEGLSFKSGGQCSVLLGNGHNLALAYVGACPFMPDSYEIVLICEDRTAAAVLAVLPSLLFVRF